MGSIEEVGGSASYAMPSTLGPLEVGVGTRGRGRDCAVSSQGLSLLTTSCLMSCHFTGELTGQEDEISVY